MLKKKFGEILIDEQIINQEQLNAALAEQKESGGLIGQILFKKGLISKDQIANALATQVGIPFVEKITEQILLYEARKILFGPPFTIGIILTYFVLKQHEMKKIMTILNAKNYNYQPERISGLL